MQTVVKKAFGVSLAVACFGWAMAFLQYAKVERAFLPRQMDSFYLPSERVLRLASLGYTRMAADLMWVKTLVYFGEEILGTKRQTWLAGHVWRVVGLDPWFEAAYGWGGAALLYGGRIIDNETVEMSNAFYRAAMRRFPSNWRFPAALAFNLVYEYKAENEEEAERNRREAISLFEAASRMEGAPSYLRAMALSQMGKAGLDRMAAEYLREAYASARDEEERKLLARHMEKLGASAMDDLRFQQKRLEKLVRQTLPYAADELSLLVGPRPQYIRPDGTWEEDAGPDGGTEKTP